LATPRVFAALSLTSWCSIHPVVHTLCNSENPTIPAKRARLDARTSQSLEPIQVFFSKKRTHFLDEKWEYTQSLIKNGVLMGFFVIKSLTVLQVGVLNVTLQPEAGNFT
jgi:hypothetical protein